MYLLYLDESGSMNHDYFVVGGLLIHEQDAWRMSDAMERLESTLPADVRPIEFHATHLRAGKNAWRRVPRRDRDRITDQVTDLLIDGPSYAERPPVLFAVALHRESFPQQDPIARTYEEFFARANGFLGRLANVGDRHRCIAISDNTHEEVRLQGLMRAWQSGGATSGANIAPLASYAEVPLFVDSKASRLVQLADFVAFWVFRAYEFDDTTVRDQLLAAFDSADGRRHGLVHLVHDYRSCDCPACRSRRG